jgi:hypothetical protein
VAKGGRIFRARRSSSRERRVFEEGSVISFMLRHGRDARGVYRRKTPWIGKAHAFHEAPAEPVLAAFETMRGVRRKANPHVESEEATGVSEGDRFSVSHSGRKRRRVSTDQSPKWEPRRESRFPPASFCTGRPRASRCPTRASSDGRGGTRKQTFRVNEHEVARLRYEGGLGQAPQGDCKVVIALGNDEVRVLELERFRSAEVDRTHRRSRRPWALPSAPRIRAA